MATYMLRKQYIIQMGGEQKDKEKVFNCYE